MNHHSPAPKGHHAIAQGKALGMHRKKHFQALKGRNLSPALGSAPSGRGIFHNIQPRATPWVSAPQTFPSPERA